MKKIITTLTLIITLTSANADIVSELQKIESAFAEPFYLAGENSTDLTPQMQARKDNLQMRLDNPDAWQMYKEGIDEFSYFGFKLFDVKNGNLELKDFILELQKYLER